MLFMSDDQGMWEMFFYLQLTALWVRNTVRARVNRVWRERSAVPACLHVRRVALGRRLCSGEQGSLLTVLVSS